MTTKEALELLETIYDIGCGKPHRIFNGALDFEEQEQVIKTINQALEELETYKKSDESKEQSSIDYYNEMRKYKRELAELKKKVANFIDKHMAYPYDDEGNSMDCDYTRDYERLLDLCKDSRLLYKNLYSRGGKVE